MSNTQKSRDDWWKPYQLAQAEMKCREIKNIEELDTRNDFGSYRKALLTSDLKGSNLESHNDLSPGSKIYLIRKVIATSSPVSILDAGCGMGFTTRSITEQFPNASVLGVDISRDAIELASKLHPKALFKSQGISPDGDILGRFDIIFCFEFYPFTRNNDIKMQSSFMDYFSRQLKPGGKIVIYQKWDNHLSLSAILQDVERTCSHLKFSTIRIPHHKIYKYIPSLTISKILSLLLGILLNRDLVRNIIVVTNK